MNRRAVRNISRAGSPGSNRVRPRSEMNVYRRSRSTSTGPIGDPGQVRVAPDVVEVVDGEDARQQRLQPADPTRHGGSARAGLETRNDTHAGSIDSSVGEAVAFGDRARCPPQPTQERPELALDDQLRQVFVGQPLAGRPARVGRRGERRQDVVVEEMGERAVPDVVEQAGHPQGLDDQALRRERFTGRDQGRRRLG